MFNRSTCFMDGDFTRSDPETLESALKNMQRLNNDHLGILQYTSENFFYDPNKTEVVFSKFKRRSAITAAYTN